MEDTARKQIQAIQARLDKKHNDIGKRHRDNDAIDDDDIGGLKIYDNANDGESTNTIIYIHRVPTDLDTYVYDFKHANGSVLMFMLIMEFVRLQAVDNLLSVDSSFKNPI